MIYLCITCGYLYEESEGLPDLEIAPGTGWASVPADFTCPDCGADKINFGPLEPAARHDQQDANGD